MKHKDTPTPNGLAIHLDALVQPEIRSNPEASALYDRVTGIFEADGIDITKLQPGEEQVGEIPVPQEYQGSTLEARFIAKGAREQVDGSFREPSVGLRFAAKEGETLDIDIHPEGFLQIGTKVDQALQSGESTEYIEGIVSALETAHGQHVTSRQKRMLRRQAIEKRARKLGIAGVCVLAAGGAVYGAVHVVTKAKLQYVFMGDGAIYDNRFDSKLPGGSVSSIGQTVAPESSKELYQNSDFKDQQIPQLNRGRGLKGYEGRSVNSVSVSDGLRQIGFGESKPGGNCKVYTVSGVREGATMRSWTDTFDEEGRSRANEFRVKLDRHNPIKEEAKLSVCWFGVERNKSDDPRVVFDVK